MEFSAHLIKSVPVATETLRVDFQLETPDYVFQAGQAALFSFSPEAPLADNSRIFSIASSPEELPVISIATRLTPGSVFKQALKAARLGQKFLVEAPIGDFVLPTDDSAKNLIFMAGGIGITPFRSMIRTLLAKRSRHFHLFLVTVNRTRDDIPFLSECQDWEDKRSVVWESVLTQEGLAPESTRQERISEGLNRILEKAGEDSLFYLAGPPGMVDAFHEMLLGQFLVPESRIKTEMFFGYQPH